MFTPFTQPWATALCVAINDDAAYREAARNWTWPLALVLESAPEYGFAKDTAALLQLERGSCNGAQVLPAADASAPFMLRAPYAVWKRVATGELDPIMAVAKGEVKLTGSLATLMFHTRSAKALVDCVRRLPTLYPDEQQQQVK